MATLTVRHRTLVVVLVTSAVLGMGVRGLITQARSGSASPPGPPTVTAAGPGSETAGIQTGFPHSEAGATEAATTDVRQGQRLYDLPATERIGAVQALASTAATSAYLAESSAQLAELDGIAGRGHGHLTWDVSPLATRLDAYTPQRARVSVWRVGVLSISGLTAPIAEWTTVAYEFVWERDDWRIWSETQTPGPTPMNHPDAKPSTPEQLRSVLAGFIRYPGTDPL